MIEYTLTMDGSYKCDTITCLITWLYVYDISQVIPMKARIQIPVDYTLV